MSAVALDEDFHVHSTWSDDAHSTVAENLAAAAERGLRRLRLVEHVRRTSAWLPDYTVALTREARPAGLEVLTGVEVKILDTSGELDVPADLGSIDAIVVADHRFPGPDGPWSPRETRERLASGLDGATALDLLVDALVAAMAHARRRRAAQLAHCFSILPKVGLTEDDLTADQLDRWAEAAARTGTAVEVNEKWACPGPRALGVARAAGVALVASSDSHARADVGRYERVSGLVAGVR